MFRWSWFAGSVTAIYLMAAGYFVWEDLRYTGGGWINLRGMGAVIVTAPSQVTLGNLLTAIGFQKVNYNDPGAWDYIQIVAHLLLSAAFIYAVALGLQLLVRRLLAPQ